MPALAKVWFAALGLCTMIANVQAGEITSSSIGLAALGEPDTGPALSWRGSLVLSGSREGFGGFSGMLLSDDCSRLTAISDDGWWLAAALSYEGEQQTLASMSSAEVSPMLGRDGKRGRDKQWRDAEALTLMDDGTLAVGFESRPRIESFNFRRGGFAAIPTRIPLPRAIAEGPENGEMEALAFARKGRLEGKFIAIAEENFDETGAVRAWVWRAQGAPAAAFSIRLPTGYRATDLVFLPGGDEALLLLRSFIPGFTGMAIARFPVGGISSGTEITPRVIFEARQPLYLIDNMEALAICSRAGETRITVMSDDNFLPALQRTLLIQFALTPSK